MRKWVKISLRILLGIVIVCLSLLGYAYYQMVGKFEIDALKYPHQVGYLSNENSDLTKNFRRCNAERLPSGYFHSSRANIFKGSKSSFTNFIHSNFQKKDTIQNGFLNLRFIVNCKGEVGDMEINELNQDFELSDLNDAMVEQLVQLTARKENWISDNREEPMDKYMYITFNIKNGDVAEILP